MPENAIELKVLGEVALLSLGRAHYLNRASKNAITEAVESLAANHRGIIIHP